MIIYRYFLNPLLYRFSMMPDTEMKNWSSKFSYNLYITIDGQAREKKQERERETIQSEMFYYYSFQS